jgi:GNAT superfamily N-acetyltransferase
VAVGAASGEYAQMDDGQPVPALLTLRPAAGGDVEEIEYLAVINGMFAAEDLSGFDEMLRGCLDGSLEGHRCVVAQDESGGLTGAAYFAPEPFADRVWNLYFLAVLPRLHGTGIGSALIGEVERTLRDAGDGLARVLIVETSSTQKYEGARRFYLRSGYDREALLREFYGPGDDKIVFWKSLRG